MKYVKRLIVAPFVLGIMLVTHLWFAIKRTGHFIAYGGEFVQYPKDEHKTIQSVYELVKDHQIKRENNRLKVADMRELEKQVTAGDISYSRMIEILNERFNS